MILRYPTRLPRRGAGAKLQSEYPGNEKGFLNRLTYWMAAEPVPAGMFLEP